jgi:dinuclear metal center YbgI/SA1388 family protein
MARTARSVPLAELSACLDSYLRITEIPDDPNALNGLQVENSGAVTVIVAAVDASLATIEGLRRGRWPGPGALLLAHHGLFWDGHRPITDRRYQRIRSLIAQDAALYSAHIPLDLHPEVGNNAVLARELGLSETGPFGEYRGVLIGLAGAAPPALATRGAVVRQLASTLGIGESAIRLIPGGPERVTRIGVITGAGGSAISQAHHVGCDTFITGEGAAHTYFDAMEWGVNVIYAGHYATETVGVRALAEHLGRTFGLPWEFHDHPTGM